jgi:hypothetical protein
VTRGCGLHLMPSGGPKLIARPRSGHDTEKREAGFQMASCSISLIWTRIRIPGRST